MKTSDKVLIGLLTMIFLTVTAVFVDIKRVIPILEQKFELENFTNLKFVNTARSLKCSESIRTAVDRSAMTRYMRQRS
jgi:hypothetical protein